MKLIHYIKNYTEIFVFQFLKFSLPKVKKHKNYLLLINTGYIGDLIVSSILLENPKIFKEYNKIIFLIKSQYLDLFTNYEGDIKFFGYNEKKYRFSILYKFKLLSLLRAEAFKTCIQLTAARGILNEEITHLSGAKELIALNSFWEYLGKHLGTYFDSKYTSIIAKKTLNEYQKHFELIEEFNHDKVEIAFNNGITFAENKLLKFNEQLNLSNYIVISPFSSQMNREWKSNYFKELIDYLKIDYQIVLIGSRNQKNKIERLITDKGNVFNLAGELNLNEIPSLLKYAKLFIGMDSGMTHLALKLNTPLISIIGGGEFGRFFPFKSTNKVKYLYNKMDCFLCHWECIKSEMFCLIEITPQIVINEVKKILLERHAV
ncbi:MAG: glycosyltransferase family 9 protein [Ignavibacteriae bacterium]|nr:glycosyltransferase family 9 protein [Ignavibacteriota bacterium]